MSQMIGKCIDHIATHSADPSRYQGLILKNGLTILLISNPKIEFSSASLIVKVGSACDPNDLPGLAHLCEHMLFCRTKTYSKKDDFKNYLINHSGYFSSQTKFNQTQFFCRIPSDNLQTLLDRFARMFFEPSFDESVDLPRGVNTVHSKYIKNFTNDEIRVEQVIKCTSAADHIFNRFDTGSKYTLATTPNLLDKLKEFFSTWYSSHLMKLVVVGTEDLNILTNWVTSVFGQIENKNVNMPIWSSPIYKEEHLSTKTVIIPLIDLKFVSVDFPIPDQKQYYKSMPTKYLSTLFNDEGPGSLITVLKNKGWIIKMSAKSRNKAEDIEMFNITFNLTNNGHNHIDEIIEFLFQYVNMLKHEGPQEWLHGEINLREGMRFRFEDKLFSAEYLYWLCSQLKYFNVDEVLTAGNLLEEWKPDLIRNLLSYFRPDNMRIMIVSKAVQNQVFKKEKYYGTRYSVTKIPQDILNKWKNIGLNEHFKLPSKNKFLTRDFDLIPENSMKLDHPYIIYESNIIRCWFKPDTEFKCPKASIVIEFSSPIVLNDPFHANIMPFVVSVMNNNIAEIKCSAARACIEVLITPKDTGFMIKLFGYSGKIDVLLQEIINKLFNFKIDHSLFEFLKEEFEENNQLQPHCEKVLKYSFEILSEAAQNSVDFINRIPTIKIEQIEEFMNKFLAHGIFMELLVFGNINEEKALGISQILKKPFSTLEKMKKQVTSQIYKPRDVILETGENVVFETTGYHPKKGCVFVNFQCGMQSPFTNMVFFLFSKIMNDVFYKNAYKMRNQYLLKVVPLTEKGLLYLGIIDQSEQNSEPIDGKIELYIESIKEALDNMTENQFNAYKKSMYNYLLKKPTTMKKKAYMYENDIFVENYNFNRVQSEIDQLMSITLEDIAEFYNNNISQRGRKRRKLTIHVKSLNNQIGGNNSESIINIRNFKQMRHLYQLPCQSIPAEYYSQKN